MLKPTLLEDLADLLASDVDSAAMERARLHIMDWIGCAIAGRKYPAGEILANLAGPSLSDQVFAWGGLGNILEMDDVDKRALLHPGPGIVPAAWVLAHDLGAPREALLAAIVRGYEATIRLGRAVGPAHYALWHSTGTCSAIGAAAACASLHGLDQRKTAQAMSLALSQSAGLWQTRHEPQSMGKQLHTAHAARAGFDAARLAGAGFCGPLTILEGEQGFFAALCSGANPTDVLKPYDQNWLIHEVSFKPWPACRHAHAAIDAALILRSRGGPDGDEPILVYVYADAQKFCDKPNPTSEIEAKFSLQHAVAVALVRGEPRLEDFLPNATEAPDLVAMRQRVQVLINPAIEARYPGRFGASISVKDHSIDVLDALGDPENPVSEIQLEAKMHQLLASADIPSACADEILDGLARPGSIGLAQVHDRLRRYLA